MEFRGYSLRYRSDMNPVLRDVSIVVHAGEKVSPRQLHLCSMEGGREGTSWHMGGGAAEKLVKAAPALTWSSGKQHRYHAPPPRGSYVVRPPQDP